MLYTLKRIRIIIVRDGFWYTVKRIYAYLIAHSPLAYRASFRYQHTARLVLAPSHLTYVLFANRSARTSDVALMRTRTPANGTVIDVGGNIGSIAIPAGQHVGPKGNVLVFEPSKKFAHIIKTNIALNKLSGNVTLHDVALGETETTVYLNEAVADDTTNHVSSHGTPVQQKTLDSYTASFDVIDFLKIDVEGYELNVLKGASETLQKTKCLYIEFIPKNLARAGTTNPHLVLDILTQHFTLHIKTAEGLKPFIYEPDAVKNPDLVCLSK